MKPVVFNSCVKVMKFEVQFYVAGTVFYETVVARNYQEAKQTALARNPNAKVIAVTAKFN